LVPDLEAFDFGSGDEDGSDVAPSSDEETNEHDIKKGVEDILKDTIKTLKRGKTMALNEAIAVAKKTNVDRAMITEAQTALDEYKIKQHREDVEKEVKAFMASPTRGDIPTAEKVVKKVKEAGCRAEVMQGVQEHLDMLIETRPLEDQEMGQALESLRCSCREFVVNAVKGNGRDVLAFNLDNGRLVPACLQLDPPLQILRLVYKHGGGAQDAGGLTIRTSSLKASRGKDNPKLKMHRHFSVLDPEEQDCFVAVNYESDSGPGLLCLQEPTPLLRDKLRDAFVFLEVLAPS